MEKAITNYDLYFSYDCKVTLNKNGIEAIRRILRKYSIYPREQIETFDLEAWVDGEFNKDGDMLIELSSFNTGNRPQVFYFNINEHFEVERQVEKIEQ